MKTEKRFLPLDAAGVTVEERDEAGVKSSVIVGYASVFYDGTPATEYKLGKRLVERVIPGAFDKALAGDDIRALFNHDPNQILGRGKAGTLRLSVDARGLRFEISPPDTQLGRDLLVSLKRRDVTGSSFSFSLPDWNKDQVFRQEGDLTIREIRNVSLYDVGPVTFPAYTGW